jgi:hypothetical protein
MAQRELEISISQDGTVEVHVKGFKGKSCSEAVKLLQQVVGELKSEQKTSEFYEPEETVKFHLDQRH